MNSEFDTTGALHNNLHFKLVNIDMIIKSSQGGNEIKYVKLYQ